MLRTLLVLSAVFAQDPQPSPPQPRWDVKEARGTTRQIDFTTTEGTEMSVDISPDGQWLVFDLLAHVYRVPPGGGAAVPLTQTSGVALNYQPRISPDGKLIAFVSDRDGQNNLWVMNPDGTHPRAVFRDQNVRVRYPAWTPDGQYIVAQRQVIPAPGAPPDQSGSGLWMYHKDGGEGVRLVADAGAQWPRVSPDGKYLYYQARVGTGDDPVRGNFTIRRFEFATGTITEVMGGTAEGAAAGRGSSGGALTPEVSPDGRWLAFARPIPDGIINYRGHRHGPRNALWLLDLTTGVERVLMDPISFELPSYAWARDGKSIVLSQGGGLRRVEVATGTVSSIPFNARVQRTISEMARKTFRISDDAFTSKFLRWTNASPDGRRAVFQSIGRVWLIDLPNGTPRRLTGDAQPRQEFAPSWSPNGQWIAYTTWDDTAGGHLWKVSARGGEPRRLTTVAGEYVHPAWSADSRELVLVRGGGATRAGRTISSNPFFDVVRISADGGPLQQVARVALPPTQAPSSMARRGILQPSFGPDGRVFFPELKRIGTGSQTQMVLVSVKPDGSDKRDHLALATADEMVPSPDGKWVAFEDGDNVYVTALPWSGTGAEPLAINKRRGALPVRQLSTEGGLFPKWRNANTLEFSSSNRFYVHRLDTQKTDTFTINLTVPRRVPNGTIAFTGARMITLKGDEVIQNGNLVVRGSRVVCAGSSAACPVPAGAQSIDVAGKTIIPGWVDMHSHHYREHRGFRPLRDYEVAIYLAYGVTTSLDNSMWSQNIFPTAELIEAGQMIGPRTFSTGDPLYRGDAARQNEISSFEVARQNVARLLSWGATSIKQYQQPRRDQRQWVSHAARQLGANVTAEGGDIWYNMSMIMDGQTGWEHPIDVVPLYTDVTRFFGLAGTHYSPTLVVGTRPWNIEYFYAERDVWKDPKQQRWLPWRQLFGHLRTRTLRPATDYSYPLLALGLADIMREGGNGAIGSHGEHHGLAPHWEVWMAASALGNLGALRLASLGGAKFLGAEHDLGSLEPGKLADLMILNSNPLDNIRNTLDLRYVMKGGVLYDADTLDEVWPEKKAFGSYYWVDPKALRGDEVPFDLWRR